MTVARLSIAALAAACAGHPALRANGDAGAGGRQAEGWPEADALFRGDPRWVGGDGAFSVALGDDRFLWLFGDTFVSPEGAGRREGAVMVRNSVAVQRGADPTSATIEFFWGGRGSAPASFFPEAGERWRWPLHGARAGGALLLFLAEVVAAPEDGLGFRSAGWTAALVENPDEDPPAWEVRWIETPATSDVVVGAAVLVEEDRLLAYAVREPGSHDVLLARFAAAAAARGDLREPEWWSGTGWVAHARAGEAAAVIPRAATELSVHRDAAAGAFVQTQTEGFGAADVVVRTAPRPEGPWSAARRVFRPPESDREGLLVYAGKAHPWIDAGGALAISYAANALDFGRLVRDLDLYWPRFVRLPSR